jgi:hypothetical protein
MLVPAPDRARPPEGSRLLRAGSSLTRRVGRLVPGQRFLNSDRPDSIWFCEPL